MGGMDRVSTVVNAIRAERPEALLLDGGDTWHGSYTAEQTAGQDVVNVMNALKPDAMTSHWEFTFGVDRVNEIVETLDFPFLGANIFDNEWDEPAYEPYQMFERGGAKVAVIGQAFPYLPIANPRWMFPGLSFGIRQERMEEMVAEVRDEGADVVVCLSHNGFDVDRKMAAEVEGIDVILCGHTHDALPEPLMVGKTALIASGSNGKFISRIDLDVRDGGVQGLRHKLIPIFSDVIAPDPEMTALVDAQRAPFKADLEEVLGHTDSLLYRRGNFNGTWDDLICNALIEEREADIALSARFPLGAVAAARRSDHARGSAQRHRHVLSGGLPDGDDRRVPAHGAGGCGRQPVQPGSLLPAGRRHGARRRHGLPHRRVETAGQPDHQHDAAEDRRGDRPGQDLHGRGLGQCERGYGRPADLGGLRGYIKRKGRVTIDPNKSVQVTGA